MLHFSLARRQHAGRPFGNVTKFGLACTVMVGLGCELVPPKQGVFIGAEFLSKETFAELPERPMGKLQHISYVASPGRQQHKVAVCTGGYVWFINPETRNVERRSPYRRQHPVPVDADGDGTLEVMCRGGGFGEVGLYDNKGIRLWERTGSYGHGPATVWMSAGDLDKDGKMEFYLATTDGLQVLDPSGKEVRHINAGLWYMHVEVLDAVADHEPMIIASLQAGRSQLVELRDSDGKLLRSFEPADGVHSFRALWWPVGDKGLRLLTSGSTELWEGIRARVVLLDGRGKVALKHVLPSWMGSPFGIQGTIVRFRRDEPHYLAVLLRFRSSARYSVLYVFSLDGTVLYGEVLPQTWGLAVAPFENGEEVLLVGDGRRKVASYRRAEERLGKGKKRP